MRTPALAFVLGLIVALPLGASLADTKKSRSSHLGAAQKLAAHAAEKLAAAEQAGELDAGGHAARAKTLLAQANAELKLALDATK